MSENDKAAMEVARLEIEVNEAFNTLRASLAHLSRRLHKLDMSERAEAVEEVYYAVRGVIERKWSSARFMS